MNFVRRPFLLTGRPEINILCPAITPTLGSELVTNGDMELDANWTDVGTPAINERSAEQAHGDTYSRKYIPDATYEGVGQNLTLTSDVWYYGTGWSYGDGVHGQFTRIKDGAAYLLFNGLGATVLGASWSEQRITFRGTGVDGRFQFMGADAGTFYADDASLKSITFSSTLTYLGVLNRQTGTWMCTPTVALGTQAGILLNYADQDNFLALYVSMTGTTGPAEKAYLEQRDGSVWTTLRSGDITYGAGKTLAVYINGTTAKLYYDGIQVGADATITAAGLNARVYGFNTYSGNTVGLVRTSKATNP